MFGKLDREVSNDWKNGMEIFRTLELQVAYRTEKRTLLSEVKI
jgi:hypothetical protein